MSTCQIVSIKTLSKHLIGVTPSEAVSLASDQNIARTHEKEATDDCGIMSPLKEGDTIMTGKDLDIGDELMKKVSISLAAYHVPGLNITVLVFGVLLDFLVKYSSMIPLAKPLCGTSASFFSLR